MNSSDGLPGVAELGETACYGSECPRRSTLDDVNFSETDPQRKCDD